MTNSDFMSALTSGFHTESSKSRSMEAAPSLDRLLLLLSLRPALRLAGHWYGARWSRRALRRRRFCCISSCRRSTLQRVARFSVCRRRISRRDVIYLCRDHSNGVVCRDPPLIHSNERLPGAQGCGDEALALVEQSTTPSLPFRPQRAPVSLLDQHREFGLDGTQRRDDAATGHECVEVVLSHSSSSWRPNMEHREDLRRVPGWDVPQQVMDGSGRGSHDKHVALASVIRNTRLVLGSFSARYILQERASEEETKYCVCSVMQLSLNMSSDTSSSTESTGGEQTVSTNQHPPAPPSTMQSYQAAVEAHHPTLSRSAIVGCREEAAECYCQIPPLILILNLILILILNLIIIIIIIIILLLIIGSVKTYDYQSVCDPEKDSRAAASPRTVYVHPQRPDKVAKLFTFHKLCCESRVQNQSVHQGYVTCG
ncbi:hypothetical protein CRUP_019711 [Coryphaenoides rupestris]|nr:hypothetical protein CRUP_019711 [Coryphaenoides rupestris]